MRTVVRDTLACDHRRGKRHRLEGPLGGNAPLNPATLMRHAGRAETAINVQPAPWWRMDARRTLIDALVLREPRCRDGHGATAFNDPYYLVRTPIDLTRDGKNDRRVPGVSPLPALAPPADAKRTPRVGGSPRSWR
jgi:hypothetical protein